MSYRVEYGEKIKWEKAEEDWGMRRVIITGIFCMFFVLLVHLFWEEGKEVMIRLLVPGDAVTTWNSVQQLAEHLRQGIPLEFAAKEFCHEILQTCY